MSAPFRRIGLYIGLILFGLLLYHVAFHPVLFRSPWENVNCIECGGPGFVLLNPLRDRAPEKVAQRFLQRLKDGQCVEAMRALPTTDDQRKYICDAQEHYLLDRWQLGDRYEKHDCTTLLYLQWSRNQVQKQQGPSWLWIEIDRGQSSVKSYGPIY